LAERELSDDLDGWNALNNEHKFRLEGERVRLCSEEAIEIAGQMLVPDQTRAYVEFFMAHAFPVVVASDGTALHPQVVANSYRSLLHKVFDTNFFAQVALTETLLPLIKKSPAGRIVNLSSILGSLTLHADPKSPIYDAKSFAYDASKSALNAFTIHLAYELRNTNIKVNSAHPGWVKTDMGGQSATLEVSEGGKTSAALALLSNDGPTGGYFHMGKPLPW